MLRFLTLASALLVASAEVYFEEDFSGDWESKWVLGKPAGKEMGKWATSSGKWFVDMHLRKIHRNIDIFLCQVRKFRDYCTQHMHELSC